MAVGADLQPSFVVYGPVGSGLSTALKAFREFQYMTLAGVSPESMDRFLLMGETEGKPVAITPEFPPEQITSSEAFSFVENLKKQHPTLKCLFLSCPTEVLVQRFTAHEKRHPHEKTGLKDAIEQEQQFYAALKPLSDYHIDTSHTSDSELRLKIAKLLNIQVGKQPMTVNLTSFGFKNGVPTDAEMVFDMRFLPNPFYDETLRPFTGLDKPVKDYVFSFPETHEFVKHWQNLLAHSLPLYQQQGKTRVTIGIGCTGGQHRSVAMTSTIADFLQNTFPDYDIRVIHREQSHWPQQTPTAQR